MRTDQYKPGIARLALAGLGGTLLLIYAGAFTTSIDAGMVFNDWPLSNGSINPEGWTQDIPMLAEHSHRLLGMLVGIITIALAIWIHLRESRSWARVLAWVALGSVVVQGLLGGFRVLGNSTAAAMVHGILGQVVVCVLVATALSQSRIWFNYTTGAATEKQIRKLRGFGIGFVAAIAVQLVVGAAVRHGNAGLAMPTFPLPLIPEHWNHAIGMHFLHRVLALLIFIKALLYARKALAKGPEDKGFRALASTSLALVFIQIALGATAIWTMLAPLVATLHVVNGAALLAVTWASVFLLFRKPDAARAGAESIPEARA